MVDNNYAFTYHEYTEMSEDRKDFGVYVSGKKKCPNLTCILAVGQGVWR